MQIRRFFQTGRAAPNARHLWGPLWSTGWSEDEVRSHTKTHTDLKPMESWNQRNAYEPFCVQLHRVASRVCLVRKWSDCSIEHPKPFSRRYLMYSTVPTNARPPTLTLDLPSSYDLHTVPTHPSRHARVKTKKPKCRSNSSKNYQKII